jgi:hypothetical protein
MQLIIVPQSEKKRTNLTGEVAHKDGQSKPVFKMEDPMKYPTL